MHFGEFLIQKKIMDEESLVAALDAQHKERQMVGQLAVQRGWLNAKSLYHILTEQRRGKNLSDEYFGQVAVQLGHLNSDQVKELLHDQEHTTELLGDILISRGTLSRPQLIALLNEYRSEIKGQNPGPT